MAQFDNVAVVKKANIYFDGKCVSHTVVFPDGMRKTVGVIFPSRLTFNTQQPETVEILSGQCRVRRAGEESWTAFGPDQSFEAPGNSSFEIEVIETVNYVCHFG